MPAAPQVSDPQMMTAIDRILVTHQGVVKSQQLPGCGYFRDGEQRSAGSDFFDRMNEFQVVTSGNQLGCIGRYSIEYDIHRYRLKKSAATS